MPAIRVWDLPTRLFHWSLATCVVALIVSGSVGGAWMEWHFRLGYATLTLLLFRLGWGFVGGYWSRFAHFIPWPGAIVRYLKGKATPLDTLGHNPLGSLSVYVMLLALLGQAVSGLFADDAISYTGPLAAYASEDTVSLATWYHADIGKPLLIALAVLHVLAIVFYRLVRGQRLVAGMVHGDRQTDIEAPASADGLRQRLGALVLLAICAGFVWWLVSLGASAGGY